MLCFNPVSNMKQKNRKIQKFSTINVFKPIFLIESQIDLAKTVLKKRQFHFIYWFLNTKLKVH